MYTYMYIWGAHLYNIYVCVLIIFAYTYVYMYISELIHVLSNRLREAAQKSSWMFDLLKQLQGKSTLEMSED